MIFDVLYIATTDEECIEAQEIGIKNGFLYGNTNDSSVVQYNFVTNAKFFIFSFLEDNTKEMISYSEYFYNGEDEFVNRQLTYNDGNYYFATNLDDLDFSLKNKRGKIIPFKLENPVDRLIYENKYSPYNYVYIIVKVNSKNEVEKLYNYIDDIVEKKGDRELIENLEFDYYPNYVFIDTDIICNPNGLQYNFDIYDVEEVPDSEIKKYCDNNKYANYEDVLDMENISKIKSLLNIKNINPLLRKIKNNPNDRLIYENNYTKYPYTYIGIKVGSEYELEYVYNYIDDLFDKKGDRRYLNQISYPNYMFMKCDNVCNYDYKTYEFQVYGYGVVEDETIKEYSQQNPSSLKYDDVVTTQNIPIIKSLLNIHPIKFLLKKYNNFFNRNIYEGKEGDIIFDVFFFPNTNEEVVDALKIAKSLGYEWGINNDRNGYDSISDCMCFIFSVKNDIKKIYKYQEENDIDERYVINDNLEQNHGNYLVIKNISDLEYSLEHFKKPFIYSKKNVLVYEKKEENEPYIVTYELNKDDDDILRSEISKCIELANRYGFKNYADNINLNRIISFGYISGLDNVKYFMDYDCSSKEIIEYYNTFKVLIVKNIKDLEEVIKTGKIEPYFMKKNELVYEKNREIKYCIITYNLNKEEDIRRQFSECKDLAIKYGFQNFADDVNFNTILSVGYIQAKDGTKYFLDYECNSNELKETYFDMEFLDVKDFDELEETIKTSKLKPYYMKKNRLIYENDIFQVVKFNEFDNLEYRKGSQEYGGILIKLLEFLRLYKTEDTLTFKLNDFIQKSHIPIEEIKKLIESREKGQRLYDFEITLDKGTISFSNLNKTGKNRPFESNNT